jgi:7,8-dihydropterin-6-yl-methyl-4-(beta-D-ribofuranosyl)aminobenzene 5'-phosphate synthase
MKRAAIWFFVVLLCWPSHAVAQSPSRIVVLYDAFGKSAGIKKDWGFATLIEYGGKRILFDTGNNAEIFADNVKSMSVRSAFLGFCGRFASTC